MSELRRVEFPDKDLPLREDVSLLGRLVGEALVEQHGPELLDQVEAVRAAAIRMREQGGSGAESLEASLEGLGSADISRIIKAFSTYLRLANLAEKVHRIRRRREYFKQGATAQRGSLEEVMAGLVADGIEAGDISAAVERLRIRPVFTAHPTEATRRSFLEKEYSIVHRLVERLNPDRTPQEEQQALDRIRDAIHSAWQTSAVPHVQPTVADELDNVLFYLTEILYRIAPPFHDAMRKALAATCDPGEATAAPNLSGLLRFGSWVGGDMDGNPNVTGQTLLESLATQREAVLRCYLPEVRRLARYLSQTRPQAEIDEAVDRCLEEYRARMPDVFEAIPERHRDMPYRALLTCVAARLEDSRRDGPHAYDGPGAFAGDIARVADSLFANRGQYAGLFGVHRLQQRIGTFGFHLATLDARQDALLHREVMAELLQMPGWPELDADQRSRELAAEGIAARLAAAGAGEDGLSAQAAGTLEVFRAIKQARRRFGEEAFGLFIISMTQGADDVLTTLALARAAGLEEDGAVPLDVAPLLETVGDLESGPAILEHLLAQEDYRAHLARRGQRQVIMVGYSDSSKDSGIVAARWGLQEAQRALAAIGRKNGIEVLFFHGRGGTVSRGGGNLVKGIEGAPEGSMGGFLRVTEQGEVINQKYGVRPIAVRNLEIMTGAVLRHGLADTGQRPEPAMRDIMAEMAATARGTFRELVYDSPDFVPYFRSATPIDVIERLQIGSRPASRRSGGGVENLRAIPWVFSWAQVRLGLPGVYGLGTALSRAGEEHGLECLRDMHARWAFFQGLLNDAEMVLAKSVLDIGERYAQLAEPGHRGVFDRIREEFDRTRQQVLAIKGAQRLLEGQHTLRRNIRLRNPYADPMHLLQIDLLRKWRDSGREDEDLLFALKSTVNGIALAIQNTG